MKNPEYFSIWQERQKEEKRRRPLAIKKAKAVAKTLKEKYQAEEVILSLGKPLVLPVRLEKV